MLDEYRGLKSIPRGNTTTDTCLVISSENLDVTEKTLDQGCVPHPPPNWDITFWGFLDRSTVHMNFLGFFG